MEKNKIEEEFRKEILTHKEDYPNLYKVEAAKNTFHFQQQGD